MLLAEEYANSERRWKRLIYPWYARHLACLTYHVFNCSYSYHLLLLFSLSKSKGVVSTECRVQSTSDMHRIHVVMHSMEAQGDADVLFKKLIVHVYTDAR